MSRPHYVGDFATDFKESRIHLGRARARYLYESLVNKTDLSLDLNHGLEIFEGKPDEDEHLDGLLKYIMAISEPKSDLKKVIHNANVVSWRGTLTRIGASPYDASNSDGWKVLCSMFDGVMFLCELSTDSKVNKRGQKTDRDKRMTYWGYKFEQYTTTELPNEPPETSFPVSTMANYSAVFTLDLGNRDRTDKLRIFTGAEMDCLNGSGDFVELKTQFKQLGIGRYWYQKEMKWWLQSFLVGIDTIIIGLRDDDGIVREVKPVKVNDLARRPNGWDPAVCLNFLITFLREARSQLKNHNNIIAEFDPRQRTISFKMPHSNEKQDAFIHDFVDHFKI
ncbi:unnamed protein product [Bursaphelenchus okinawaensis]|uniref:Decapping nuclease n=1 Tax=Bursaphelenchus okinawaensis TaxID=465554 RepID=A0A811JTM9_9BILA|nr:unnamed protein product [Bursaphelenchus okinawaensis]CAG9082387.1 unnamed protein product [Bursaphelenchus okinawaensis]